MKGILCIGGPKAGQRVETTNGHPRFVASEPDRLGPDTTVAADNTEAATARSARWRQVLYHLEHWSNGDGTTTHVFVPAGQTTPETMDLLLAAYEAGARR